MNDPTNIDIRTQALFIADLYHDDELRSLLNENMKTDDDGIDFVIDENNNTLMQFSAKKGYLPLTILLMDAGMSPSIQNYYGENALVTAALSGQLTVVEYLLNKGHLDGKPVDGKEQALLVASGAGFTDIAEVLINHGADVDSRDANLNTPLIMAAKSGFYETVMTLLAHKANPNARDDAGDTSLIMASFYDHAEIAHALIKAGAEVNHQNDEGTSSLHMAASKSNHGVAHLLVDKGANVNATDKDGKSPLSEAVGANDEKMVLFLTEKGSRVLSDKNGITHLMMASSFGYSKVLLSLLQADGNAHINDANENGYTAMVWAILDNHHACVEILLDNGAEANILYGKKQETPLMLAAKHGHAKIVDLLLAAGADTTIVSSDGLKAMDKALERNWFAIADKIKTANQIPEKSFEF